MSITANCKDKLFSYDLNELYNNRKISLTRLQNIFNIIENVLQKIDGYKFLIAEIDMQNNYINLLEKYRDSYDNFKKLFIF